VERLASILTISYMINLLSFSTYIIDKAIIDKGMKRKITK